MVLDQEVEEVVAVVVVVTMVAMALALVMALGMGRVPVQELVAEVAVVKEVVLV
jgi:hypothetical protein